MTNGQRDSEQRTLTESWSPPLSPRGDPRSPRAVTFDGSPLPPRRPAGLARSPPACRRLPIVSRGGRSPRLLGVSCPGTAPREPTPCPTSSARPRRASARPAGHLPQLAQEAIVGALTDAGLTPDDLGAVVVANFLGGPNEGQLHLNSVVAGLMPGLHLPSWRVEAACASGGVALHQALLALHAYDPILVLGIERLSGVVGIELTRNIGMAGDVFLDQSVGLTFPANYAIVAQRHMEAYGTTTRDFELVSLKNHANARLNPKAHFHHKLVEQSGHRRRRHRRQSRCGSSTAARCPTARPPSSSPARAAGPRSVAVTGSAVSSDAISLVQRPVQTSFAAADGRRRARVRGGRHHRGRHRPCRGPRLLHHRRARGHGGPGPRRAGRRGGAHPGGRDRDRRLDPRQPERGPQGRRPRDRRHRRRPGRRGRHPAARRGGRAAGRGRPRWA